MFHVWKARVSEEAAWGGAGLLLPQKRRLLVACGAGTTLELLDVQIEGRKRMSAEAFLNGQRLNENETLGETNA
jgi:methionyl-tRNA formyltransferase